MERRVRVGLALFLATFSSNRVLAPDTCFPTVSLTHEPVLENLENYETCIPKIFNPTNCQYEAIQHGADAAEPALHPARRQGDAVAVSKSPGRQYVLATSDTAIQIPRRAC